MLKNRLPRANSKNLFKSLVEVVATAGVTSRISAQETEDKQTDEEGDGDVYNDLERYHFLLLPKYANERAS